MARLDPTTAWEWLERDLEGEELSTAERAALAEALVADPELASEHRKLAEVGSLLASHRVEVAAGFSAQVMTALPVAGWEARHPRSWRLAMVILLLLGGGAAALLGTTGARLAPAGPFANALLAVSDLFRTAALTGAGLLAASWKGLGLVFGSALPTTGMVAFGLLVIGVNLGLFVLLRRSAPRPDRQVVPATSGRSTSSR